ncbi:trypsin-like serine peptidase [Staphylococcus americanisciuri]|uniref:Serine protease n=1 Tax=Staphylococcus americanisciuri TaxID=2973940 RepID=A0ABT2F185_9STAP|nr:serine protease [Staphylococcus americanisciuri]MCS4486220.1 serine protease [Staphylococcus americanisciuri]
MKKFCINILSCLIFIFLIPPIAPSVQADAYNSNSAYDRTNGSEKAFNLAQTIDDDAISIGPVQNPIPTNLQAIGRFANGDAISAGTAVVIGDYTLLTNNHLVEDTITNKGARNYRPASPDKLFFYPMQTPNQTPYTFRVASVHMIKGVDLAVVQTKEKLSDKIKPMPIASEQSIDNMTFKDPISLVGYPKTKYFESRYPELAKIKYRQLFETNGFFLNVAKTSEPQFYINAIARKGNSGSAIMNSNSELIGIYVSGFNNSGTSSFKYNVEEMGYGVALTKEVRKEVLAYKK